MFCTAADFDLVPYNIPNLNLVVNTFQEYINGHEQKALKRLLGVSLYNEFIQAREAMPPTWDAATAYMIGDRVVHGVDIWVSIADSTGVVPDENASWTIEETGNQWLKLEFGSTFTFDNGVTTDEWLGLADMFRPYIYSQWLRDTFDNNSGIGVVQAKAENSEVISPALRVVRSHNEYSFKAIQMQFFIAAENVPDEIYLNWNQVPIGTLNTFNL